MIVSVIAACVAMVAVVVALWQAREAKAATARAGQAQQEAAAARKAVEQATASAVQAKAAAGDARKAAEASRQAGEAANTQAGLARRSADEAAYRAADALGQVEGVREQLAAERRGRGMPAFEIAPGAADEFHLSYRGGPAVLGQVSVSVVPGSRVLGLSLGDEPHTDQVDVGPLADGQRVLFRAATGQRASAVFSIQAESWEPVVVRAEHHVGLRQVGRECFWSS